MKKYLILLLTCLCFPAQIAAKIDEEEEQLYNNWYDQIIYVLDNVSSRKAIDMIGEMRDYADRHDSKYGFFMVTYLSAHIAKDVGLYERAEELMLQSIDYKKRNFPTMKPMIQVYDFLTDIYNDRGQGEKAIQALDNALKHKAWSSEDRIALLSMKCEAVAGIEPLDTARFMKYYGEMHDAIRSNYYKGDANTRTECYHAKFTHDYQRLLDLAEKIKNKAERLKFKISAYDEVSGKGLVRHVLIRKGFTSGQIMVCLVLNYRGEKSAPGGEYPDKSVGAFFQGQQELCEQLVQLRIPGLYDAPDQRHGDDHCVVVA